MGKTLLLLMLLSVIISNEARSLDHLEDALEEYVQNGATSRAEENSGLFEGDIVIDEDTKRSLFAGDITSRDAITIPIYYWPQGVLYYMFDEKLAPSKIDLIRRGIHHLKERTCLKFVELPRSDKIHKSHVRFISGDGCFSRVGRDPNNIAQDISIGDGCERLGTVVHEIMHALGFFHEHTRPDRDKYILIDWQNIQKDHEYNFEKYSRNIGSSFGKPYDYESVMHYSKMAFCKDCGKPTITPTDQKAVIGQRLGLSYFDRKEINSLYSCKEDCIDRVSPYKCLLLRSMGSCKSYRLHEKMVSFCAKSCDYCASNKTSSEDSKASAKGA